MKENENEKKKTKERHYFVFAIALVFFVIFIFPLYWMLVTALKTQVEIFQVPTPIFPRKLTLEPFAYQLSVSGDTLRGFKNSLIIAVGTTVISTLLAIPASYGLARFKFRGNKIIILLFLIMQMLPSTLVLTSLYIMFSKLKLLSSYWSPILADATLGIPFSVIVLRTYFISIPKELDEAARIDGASEIKIFNSIVLPLMKPAIAVQAIFTFVASWNNYFTPNLIISSKMKKTLPILLAELRNSDWKTFDMGQVYAMIAFAIFPVIVVYLLLSKYIVGGVTAGGVKE